MGVITWIRCKIDPEYALRRQHELQRQEDERRQEIIRQRHRDAAFRVWAQSYRNPDTHFPGAPIRTADHDAFRSMAGVSGRLPTREELREDARRQELIRMGARGNYQVAVSGTYDMRRDSASLGNEEVMRIEQLSDISFSNSAGAAERLEFNRLMADAYRIIEGLEARGRNVADQREQWQQAIEMAHQKWGPKESGAELRKKIKDTKKKARSSINFRV